MKKLTRQKVVVIGAWYQKENDFQYYIEETNNLCDACEFDVVHVITQKMEKEDRRTYLKKGKLEELALFVEENDIDLVVCNDELSGSQNKNIEAVIDCKVMDRTLLILEIFSRRAQTKEARLQVEIAKLNYQKPRMIGNYEDMDRQGGGGGIQRGSGETKLELDKRKIDLAIVHKTKELNKILNARKTQRQQRTNNAIPVVAVVGYTNAGKSTLMNSLVENDKEVFEKDMLFATLETSTRRVGTKGREFLMIDTVGFVSNLPTDLVAAFRSTLEEAKYADLIIHLSDGSDDNFQIHQDVVKETLKVINIDHIPSMLVYNKCDKTDREFDSLAISAKKKFNINVLLDNICEQVFAEYEEVTFEIDYNDINVMNTLRESYTILEEEFAEKITFAIFANKSHLDRYKQYLKN